MIPEWLPKASGVGAGQQAGRNAVLLSHGTEFLFRKMKMLQRWVMVMIAQQCECT